MKIITGNSNKNLSVKISKYIYNQLFSFGILKIDVINKDTFDTKNNFFSARRSLHKNKDDYGRNISLIMIN